MEPNEITYFAETDYRNRRTPFGIKAADRTRHVYVIGKTGMGKSTMLENMAIQDIKNGNGMVFIDPHGKTAELLLDYVPEARIDDVLYFAPFDMDYPISFNVMEDVGPDRRHLVVNGLMSTFEKIWVDAWSARMAYILQNTLLALLEYPGSTLLGINRMLADKDYRKEVVANITDPSVKSFWVDEFAKYTDRYTQEATPAIQNKVGQFTSNPLIRNIIGQPKSTFDFRKMMDDKKIVIVNLSKGRVGEGNANLLGSMLITKVYLAAMSRADTPESELRKLPNAYLYVDEFQSFANKSFADILSEARKYKLNLTIAHQYIEQMEEEVRAAVFGNVGTMVTFRVGAYDAEVLEKEFAPQFSAEDLVNLGIYQVYLKLMIDGVSSSPFSATTLPPIDKPIMSFKNEIMESSRRRYARPRATVESNIKLWHQPVKIAEKPKDNFAKEERHNESNKEVKREFSKQEKPLPQNYPPKNFNQENSHQGSQKTPPREPVVNPFAKAFADARIDVKEPERPPVAQNKGESQPLPNNKNQVISVAEIKNKKDDPRQREQNFSALKAALESVVKNEPVKKIEKPAEATVGLSNKPAVEFGQKRVEQRQFGNPVSSEEPLLTKKEIDPQVIRGVLSDESFPKPEE